MSHLSSIGASGRNNADVVFAPGKDHTKQRTGKEMKKNKPIFPIALADIFNQQAILFPVYKNRQNITERNTVLIDIDPVLSFIPFEVHIIVATFVVTNNFSEL
jgi:hypothetical protein